jgi:tRNA pseudouridine38-40 synthase
MSAIGLAAKPDDASTSVRLRLVVAYDGTDFHGLAPQKDVATVGATLIAALSKVVSQDVSGSFVMAGRTDAGVHAWGQVVHVDVDGGSVLDLDRLQRSVNKMIGTSVVVRSVEVVPPSFDARYSAQWRRYRYSVLTTRTADPFLARTAWHVGIRLDLAAMRLACDPLLGEHDFSSFCRVPKGQDNPSMVRRITDAQWLELGDMHEGLLRFEVQATSFCHQMVRALVGLMIDVGRGRRHAGEVLDILAARDRAASSPIAPPQGLCLWEVGYGEYESQTALRSGRDQ